MRFIRIFLTCVMLLFVNILQAEELIGKVIKVTDGDSVIFLEIVQKIELYIEKINNLYKKQKKVLFFFKSCVYLYIVIKIICFTFFKVVCIIITS